MTELPAGAPVPVGRRAPAWLTAQPIAHRGLHDAGAGRMENTLAAAEAALARGFAIECDVHVTADARAVVFHDDSLEYLTHGEGDVRGHTRAELAAVRYRDSDATIPSLVDLLDLVNGRVPIFVELKSRFDNDRRLPAVVAGELAAYDGPVATMSFDPSVMMAIRRLAPALPRGMLAGRFAAKAWPGLSPTSRFALRWFLASPLVWPTFVAWDVNALPASPPLAMRHFFDLPLLAWTVTTPLVRDVAATWADQMIFEGFDPTATNRSATCTQAG